MCGIVGYTGHRDAGPILLEGLKRLEYRGYDSAGVAVHEAEAGTQVVRSKGKLQRLADALKDNPVAGKVGIGHTRWATHGVPSEANAHPHREGKVSVIHNGIIENHLELREQLAGSGRAFKSDTDSEIFAHLVAAEHAKSPGDFRASVSRALQGVRGTWALCVLHDDHPDEIVAARRHAPLLIGLGEADSSGKENFVASDVAAMLDYTRTVVDLEDGDIALVRPDRIEIYDEEGKAIDRTSRHIDWSPMAAERQGYRHFMLKEIYEQPQVISDTLSGRLEVEKADVNLDGIELDPSKHPRITIVACGTSWHAALAGKYMIEGLARVPVEVDLASEFRYRNPIVRDTDLVIAISQSGETADTLAALREAKRLGARTLAICNVVGSTIARAADDVIYTHAGPEISVASTKAFTTQLTVLCLMAIHLGKRSGNLGDDRVRELLMQISAVPEALTTLLGQLAAMQTVARRYVNARDVLYLGRGLGFPVALEGALKLKEISYHPCRGLPERAR